MPTTTNTQSGTNEGGKGSIFTKKIGPLPVFLWLGIGGLALYLYEKHKAATTAATAATTATTAPYPTGQNSPLVSGNAANGGSGGSGANGGAAAGTPGASGVPTTAAAAVNPGGNETSPAPSYTASTTPGGATYVAGLGSTGGVPTVVNGVAMPMPTGTGAGTSPTAAQVAAASTIPYTAPSNSSGPYFNAAAVDALAGEGYPKAA